MTLNRKVLKRVHSPLKSPKRNNTSLRKKALIRQLNDEVQFGAASKANLKVVVRVRPQNKYEEENNARCIVKVVDDHMLVFDPKEENDGFFFKGIRQHTRDLNKRQNREQKFAFERVFNESSSNEDVYEATTQDIIDTVLSGYNCSVFAYGATGAGKTFTMLGKDDYPGIAFLTLMELYRRIEEIKDEKTCEVGISYIEVYNEMVRDLLEPGKPLNVQEAGRQVIIPGLSLHKPKNAEELMAMLAQGNRNRTQHPTDANAESSRSHAVFQVFVRQQDRVGNVKSNVSIAKMSMIDLAGSERGAATGFRGARFREGASINKSLLALGNCINALADGQRHIPYRDSKLTRLLKDSLGGNCRSVMIAAVSPASTTFEDTFNTLRYANRAKTIKTTIKKNILNVDHHVSNYVKIVEELRQEICSLKEKVTQYEEKEREWKAKEEAFEAVVKCPELSLEEKADFEEKIALLEKQLKEKHAQLSLSEVEPCVTEELAKVKQKLIDASLEQKALRWEFLQLESYQREIEFKIHVYNAHLQRMKIISFASKRLDKSISKCERDIRNLQVNLCQTSKLKESVQMKLSTNYDKLQIIQRELNDCGLDSGHSSKVLQDIIEKNKANLALRDLHQLSEYLRGLLKIGFVEQSASEQLILLLITAAKQFYVQLCAYDVCTPEVECLFKNIVQNMDKSKVNWADQQSESEEIRNQKECTFPQLNVSHFTSLPVASDIFISPTVSQDRNKVFRKSSMKSSSASQLPDESLNSVLPRSDLGISQSTLFSVPEVGSLIPQTPLLEKMKSWSPGLSVLSSEKQQKLKESGMGCQLPVITTCSLYNALPVESGKTLRTAPLLNDTYTSSVAKGIESMPIFVSMEEGSSNRQALQFLQEHNEVNNLNTTSLQDIEPGECSMNATFAITPAKEIHTPVDNTINANNLILSANAAAKLPVKLNAMHISLTTGQPACGSTCRSVSGCAVAKERPTSAAQTSLNLCETKDKSITLMEEYAEGCQPTVDLERAVANSVDISMCSLNQETVQAARQTKGTIKTTSRELFKSSVLDSTFSVELEERKQLENGISVHSPGCTVLVMDSPLTGNCHGRTTIFEPLRLPLLPVENKIEKSLPNVPVFVTDSDGTVTVPSSKEYNSSFKKTLNRGGTIGKETLGKKLVTPGKMQQNGNKNTSTLKRSVSTPSLTPSCMSNCKSLKTVHNAKNKFTGVGGAIQRTTSFLKAKTPAINNQENVPPVSHRAMSSAIQRDAVLSTVKHSLVNYKS